MKSTKPFKVGDSVYAIRNSAWGLKPMRITYLNTGGASCSHPDFSVVGGFYNSELQKVTKKRRDQIKRLLDLQKLVDSFKDELFGKED